MIILIETRILLQSGWWESMTWIIHFENTAYILSNHKYQCYQMVTCESDCFLQSLRGELTQENERRRLPLDVLLAWGCITLLGSSASAIIGAITLYNKVNRCLARYSPRATTIKWPTNRAPNKPAWPGPNWPKMPILGQALPVHLVPCWWVGRRLWRAGCISQDTYLLYDSLW